MTDLPTVNEITLNGVKHFVFTSEDGSAFLQRAEYESETDSLMDDRERLICALAKKIIILEA